MRDAKAQGNQGNLVMDPKLGRMVIKTDDEMGGQGPNGKYWWGQNEKESREHDYGFKLHSSFDCR